MSFRICSHLLSLVTFVLFLHPIRYDYVGIGCYGKTATHGSRPQHRACETDRSRMTDHGCIRRIVHYVTAYKARLKLE